MKLDLTPSRNTYVVPTFGGDDSGPLDPQLQRRMRRPMVVGAGVIGALVIGLGAWASVYQMTSGISAPGSVRVDTNRKTLRARDPGTVRQILVSEGSRVRAGQPLLIFNDLEARAAFDVLQNEYDQLLAQSARFTAEATGRSVLTFPPELMARSGDPRVASLIRDQEFLFTSRLQLHQSQMGTLNQRLDQIQNQVAGQQAQLASTEEQRRLTAEELAGYKKLNEQGYAPKTLILRYERQMAEFAGRKGALSADVARLRQQMGETRMNMASLTNDRQSQAAEGLREAQARLADVQPRLAATRQKLESTVVRSPVDGYVFGLTQFTVGGVVGAGEELMDVVPAITPTTVTASVSPQDVDQVKVGMPARVRLTGLNMRWNGAMQGKVTVVSADAIVNRETGASTYRVDVSVPPSEFAKLKRGTRITPGMPAEVQIVAGKRSIMGFLISPITDTIEDAFTVE